ncbi:MAG: hypothetical protein IJX77_03295 [Ruminococcus sp.]|nr:hypothetical protein [Ruminococcus sp.]
MFRQRVLQRQSIFCRQLKIRPRRNITKIIFFVTGEIPDETKSISELNEKYGFDITPYVYPDLTSEEPEPDEPEAEYKTGDIDGNSSVDSLDASEMLSLYAEQQIASDYMLSESQLACGDVNKDGHVDSLDASDILSYYSYVQTGGTDSLDNFLNS